MSLHGHLLCSKCQLLREGFFDVPDGNRHTHYSHTHNCTHTHSRTYIQNHMQDKHTDIYIHTHIHKYTHRPSHTQMDTGLSHHKHKIESHLCSSRLVLTKNLMLHLSYFKKCIFTVICQVLCISGQLCFSLKLG